MPRKSLKAKTIENTSWEWINHVNEEEIEQKQVETAYRLHFKHCLECRRNCRTNPLCITGIGEKEWYNDGVNSCDLIDPSCEGREEGSHVGLTNLGNTCYVNNFVQLWFHNLSFRKAVLLWKSTECCKTNGNSETVNQEPDSIVEHLQYLFAQLQMSKRKFVDPGPLIKFLELDTTEQQDAHEFNNLFLSVMQNQLSSQENPEVRKVIANQYEGSYDYVTICEHCGFRSSRTSTFHELDLNIKGQKDLVRCINEFLKEEKLEGSDQYFCDKCDMKRNATRRIKLKHLPPVLNFQLLRFVYDRKNGRKKKLNIFIKFPDVLDMSSYLSDNEQAVYKLSAVLMHSSSSANSGHYFSYIQDKLTSKWFDYNDQSVIKMDKLKLDSEEEVINEFESGVTKKPKVMKGHHASSSAYMLVYCRDTVESEMSEKDLVVPEKVLEAVESDNFAFTSRIEDFNAMKANNMEKHKLKQGEIRSMFEQLKLKSLDDPFEFIPVEWLTKWLNNGQSFDKINNQPYLCQHEKLSIDAANQVKCVNANGADELFENYGGGPRLRKDSLCFECVKKKCSKLQIESRSLEDKKKIYQKLRNFDESSSGKLYWIGKISLRSWRKILLNNHKITKEDQPVETDESMIDDNFVSVFNEDLFCEHNCFSNENEKRRLVSEEIWKIFLGYFPNCIEFNADSPMCQICEAEREKNKILRNKTKLLAQEIRSELSDLCNNKNRPNWSNPDVNSLYIISEEFLHHLQSFTKDPFNYELEENISNRVILCDHGKLVYPPDNVRSFDAKHPCVFVWSAEWDILKIRFEIDSEIVAKKISRDESNGYEIQSNPPFCEDCFIDRQANNSEHNPNGSTVTIYLRKVLKSEIKANDEGDDKNGSKNDLEGSENPNDYIPKKKIRKTSTPDLIESLGIRQSSRSRRIRGDKKVKISLLQTVKDLKTEITKLFSILVSDQVLKLNREELSPNDATLASLHVMPCSIITLIVDDVYRDYDEVPSSSQATAPEIGFKGTKLMES